MDAHKWISASDKDIEPIFEKMCLFVTVDLFRLADELAGISNIYTEEEDKIRGAIEDVREDMFLEEVYGKNARLENAPWLKTVSTKSKWIFDSRELRLKCFEAAGLEFDRKSKTL